MDTKGSRDLKTIADAMGSVNRSTKSLATSFRTLQGVVGGWFAYLSVRQIVTFSDEMQNLNNRLVTVTGSQEMATKTMAGLVRVANETNSSVDGVAESYTRLATALKGAGVGQEVLVEFTKALTNTFRLSGSTINETTATIVQLSQAFASGQLRGQELRSVMEQNAYVAGLLRREFGKDIYKKAADGAITAADIFRILARDMVNINKQAEALTPTINQTITKALNGLKVAILEVNKEFKVSDNFAKFVPIFIDNVVQFGRALVDLAKWIYSFDNVKDVLMTLAIVAVGTVAVLNPLATVLAVVTGAAIGSSSSVSDLTDKFRNLTAWAIQLNIWMEEISFTIEKKLAKAFFAVGLGSRTMIEDLALQLDKINDMKKRAEELGTPTPAFSLFGGNGVTPDDIAKQMEEAAKRMEKYYGTQEKKALKVRDVLAALNKEYLTGAINADQYADKMIGFNFTKLNIEFKNGKINLDAFNHGLQELRRMELNRDFAQAAFSVQEFNEKIADTKIKDLEIDLRSGKISLNEYRMEFARLSEKFSVGGSFQAAAAGYLQSVGTMGQQTAQMIQAAFTQLETTFSEFIKTGKFNFKQFTQSVLDDLMKIIVRASIIQPLAKGILDFFADAPPGTGIATNNDYSTTAANGKVFDNKSVKRFAAGGIVNGPTNFSYGTGKRGLMGEAGPEAIIPLSRGSGGKLGVEATVTPVTVNIHNNTGAEVEQRETTGPNGERMLDIIIAAKVKEQFANGTYDKSMRSNFGIPRRGQ